MTDEKIPTERLNRVERELKRLERKMDKGFDEFRKDLDRILDGTDENPGILRKLDKIDETNRLLRKLLGEEAEVNETAMTPEELANVLSDMHQNALHGEKPTMIRLFGIKYADEIRDCGASVAKIVRLSTVGDSYNAEVSKGIQLARYVIARSM